MRTLRRNRQKMYYSLQGELTPIYERDENGNIIYTVIGGKQIPLDTGEYKRTYGTPVEFFANINGKLQEVTLNAFGIDNSMNYCELVTTKGALGLKIGTIIWRTSEVELLDDDTPDIDSADYVVRGVITESLNEDKYLLKRLKVGDEE